MRSFVLILGVVVASCEVRRPADAPADRGALEASVSACDRHPRDGDCEAERRALAQARREDRIRLYRQAQ